MEKLKNKKLLPGVLIGLTVLILGAIVIQPVVMPLYGAFDGDISAAFAYLKTCLSSNAGWECVAPTGSIFELGVNPTDHSLWGHGFELHNFPVSVRTGRFAYPTVIQMPPGAGQVTHICPSDKLWVASVYKNDYGLPRYLVPYELDSARWGPDSREIESLPPEMDYWRCITSRAGNMIAWSKTWLGELIGHTWEPIPLEIDMEIYMFNEDNAGNLWALTKLGEVYVYDRLTADWTLITTLDVFSNDWSTSFEIEGDDIWIMNYTLVLYRVQLDGENQIPEEVFEFPDYRIQGLFEDAQGILWVVWQDAVWTYSTEGAREIELPYGVEHIYSAAFDYELQRLYISTSQGGVFYRTVGNTPTR